jgi:hypothetical protein
MIKTVTRIAQVPHVFNTSDKGINRVPRSIVAKQKTLIASIKSPAF